MELCKRELVGRSLGDGVGRVRDWILLASRLVPEINLQSFENILHLKVIHNMDHIVFCFGVGEQSEVVYICVFVREVLREKNLDKFLRSHTCQPQSNLKDKNT